MIGIGIGVNRLRGRWSSLMDSGKGDFTSDDGSGWAVYGTNTISVTANVLTITYVDNGYGAYMELRATGDINTDLTVGKKYRVRLRAKTSGTAVSFVAFQSGTLGYVSVSSGTFAWYSFTFIATHATACRINLGGFGAGEVFYLSNYIVYG